MAISPGRSAAVSTAFVALRPEMAGFFSEVDRVTARDMPASGQKAAGGFGNGFKSVIKGLGIATLIGGSIAAGLGANVIQKGLSRALNIQDAKASLKGLGYEVAAIEGINNDVLGAVRGTAYALDDAMKIAGSALAAGVPQGGGLTDYLKLIADTATITKSPLNEIGSIFNKVQAKGKAYTEELNQLVDRGLPVFTWLQEEYGVSAEAFSDMVSDGEVDAETFRRVITEKIGGAALASGETATGSWANMQAALGRLGAMFVSSAVANAPMLFTSITNAIDRFGESVKPFAESFGIKVGEWFTSLSKWIDDIDTDQLVQNIEKAVAVTQELIKNVADGNWEAIGANFNDFIKELSGGKDLGELGTAFTELGGKLQNLGPLLEGVGTFMGQTGESISKLLVASIPTAINLLNIFTDALTWLGDNAEWIAPIITTLAVAIGVFKLAQLAANAAELASIPLKYTQLAVNVQLARSNTVLAQQMALANGVELAGNRSRLAGLATMIASRAAMIATGVALGIQAAATGIATAAQWAWNAALTANPIGIVIVAVAALVAGIIWLATQTKFFQTVWKAVFDFVSGRVQATTNFFKSVWENAINFVASRISGTIKLFTAIVDDIGKRFAKIGEGLAGFFKGVYNYVISVINGMIGGINLVIKAINGLNIPVPKWAQDLFGGAKTIGFNIQQVGALPKLATGGVVNGSAKGTPTITGDQNRAEMITDRNWTNDLILNTTRLVKKASNGLNSNGEPVEPIQIIINPAPGMDEDAIGKAAAKYIQRNRRK
jgi:tape measure domain-containing protein